MKELLVCLVLGLASCAWAQVATTGQIVGSVQDPSGAAVPGAALRLENENTKEVQSTAAGADEFQLPAAALELHVHEHSGRHDRPQFEGVIYSIVVREHPAGAAAGTVVEFRYVGNHGIHLWHSYNVNEANIFENGFLSDFQAAQRNLAMNAANGQTGFANNDLPGQVATPIFTAAFAGLPAAQGFGNTSFINLLQTGQAGMLANTLASNSTYFCRMAGSGFEPCARLGFNSPGQYPVNFFKLNPFLTTANLLSDNSFSNYNGLQVELRQQVSHGLTLNLNYSWAHALTDRYNKNVDNSSGEGKAKKKLAFASALL